MIFFVVYAGLTCWGAFRFRRSWAGAGVVVGSLLGLWLIGWLHVKILTAMQATMYLSILRILLIPYAVLLGAVATFIVVQRRTWGKGCCQGCGYELRGLAPAAQVVQCPECGVKSAAPARR